MEKVFKGRVIGGGTLEGEAVVSHQGVNTLATFQKSALKNAKQVISSTLDLLNMLNIEVTNGKN